MTSSELKTNNKQIKFSVMGAPITHSLSPEIHTLFAAQFGINLDYQRILVKSGELPAALLRFRAEGGIGLNITAPLKYEAYVLCQPQAEAVLAQAVNTLYWDKQGQCCGLNTDGLGLLSDLTQHLKWTLENKKILICGAGGATAGILGPLLITKPAKIVIANRTITNAQALLTRFKFPNLQAAPYQCLPDTFDLIINATGTGFAQGSLFDVSLFKNTQCYDLSYGAAARSFCALAQQHGATEIKDGLGMLIEQAALSFQQWHGVMPQTRPVRAHFEK